MFSFFKNLFGLNPSTNPPYEGEMYKQTFDKSMADIGQGGGGGGFEPTNEQLAAMNSGIDTTKVGQIQTNKNDILTKLDKKTTQGQSIYSHNGETQGELSVKTEMSETALDTNVLTEKATLKYTKKKYLHTMVRYNNDNYEIPMGWVNVIDDKKEFGVNDLKKFLKDGGYTTVNNSYHWCGGCCGTTGVRNSADTGTTYVGRIASGIYYVESEDSMYFKFDYNGTVVVLFTRIKFFTTQLQGED